MTQEDTRGKEPPQHAEEQATQPPESKVASAAKGVTNLIGSFTKPKGEPKTKGKSTRLAESSIDQIIVSDSALATIVGLSAHEVPGVVGMAPASITEGLRRILGARQVDEGVVIEHPRGPDRADVELHVIVAYGVNIAVVVDSVRERVIYAAKHYAGIELEQVRVKVVGVSRG